MTNAYTVIITTQELVIHVDIVTATILYGPVHTTFPSPNQGLVCAGCFQ